MAAFVVAICVFAPPAAAQGIKINVDADRIAIRGYDPVAYFTFGKATKGDPRFEAVWQEARWHFANAKHRDMFSAEPDRYAPRYGGHCTVGLSRGYLNTVDPEAWKIVEGRLYLNFSKKALDIMLEDTPGIVAKAEKNWPAVGRR